MPAVRNSALTSSSIRNLALPILLLTLGLLALLARPALARDSEWTVECISDRHGSNSNSYLSGGRALYSHTSIQSDMVVDSPLLYDIATRQTVSLTNPTTDYIAGMGISGDRVVWGRNDLPHGATWEVMLHQITAGSTRSITQGAPYRAAYPSIGGNLVVHLAWMTSDGGQDVFVHDLETGTVRNVTGSGFSLRGIWATFTDGRWVVIQQPPETGGSAGGVFVWDSQDPPGTAPRRLDQVDPSWTVALGGGLLIWGDPSGVRALDLAGGSVRVISTGACGYAATDGNMIAWSEWDPGVGVNRIRVTDRSGTTFDDVPLLQPYLISLAVEGDRVLYSASTDYEHLTDAEVYLATRAPRFRDVGESHPYKTAIDDLYRAGIIAGYTVPDGVEFRPENAVWRAQFAKMIDITMGLSVMEGATSHFVDLGPNDPASLYPHEYVAAAYSWGITAGLTPTTFGPYEDITRAQVITMIVRAAQQLRSGALVVPPSEYVPLVPRFSDTHDLNLAIAEYNGLLKLLVGYGATWDPWAAATRAEVAQMLFNLRTLL